MEETFDLERYLGIARRWWWGIMVCALLAGVSAFVVTSLQTPVYSTSAIVLVQPPSSRASVDWQVIRYAEQLGPTYIHMLIGRPVREAAFARLGWDIPSGMWDDSDGEVFQSSSSTGGRINASRSWGNVSAESIPMTQLIRLTVTDVDPEKAATLANAIVDAFIEQYQAMQHGRYNEALEAIQAQMDELSIQMKETQTQIDALGEPKTQQERMDLTLLESTLGGYRNTYSILVRDYEQMNLLAAQNADTVAVYERARAPRVPDSKHRLRNTVLAATVGAILTVGIVLLIEYLDDTIKTPADVKRVVGLTTLGAIGKMPPDERDLIVASQPLSPISEAFRKLRTSLRFSGLDRPLRTLLVTSAGPTEGKSTTTANLSVAMAQSGLKAAILDADLRRPRQHQIFGLFPRGGLSGALLAGHIDGNLLSVPTAENLFLMAAGEKPPNPAETLGSHRMRELLDEMTEQVDIVLIDSPPVLPVTDAAVLAQEVDGVLLVVDAGKTRRKMVQQAVEELDQVKANLIGVVLNGVSARHASYYHKYQSDKPKSRQRRKKLLGTFRRKR